LMSEDVALAAPATDDAATDKSSNAPSAAHEEARRIDNLIFYPLFWSPPFYPWEMRFR
jgi:hypothetical protein